MREPTEDPSPITASGLLRQLRTQLVNDMQQLAAVMSRTVSAAGRFPESTIAEVRDGDGIAGSLIQRCSSSPQGEQPREFHGEQAPLRVADLVEEAVTAGRTALWVNFHPAFSTNRTFERWVAAPRTDVLPELGPEFGLNCWELFLYCGVRAGALDRSQIQRFYPPPRGEDHRVPTQWFRDVALALAPSGTQLYNPGSTDCRQLQRGDLIFWDTVSAPIEHVGMCTGRSVLEGSTVVPEIYSFWAMTTPDESGVGLPGVAAVTTMSVTDVTQALHANLGLAVSQIRFGRGPW